MDRSNYADFNVKITKRLLNTQSEAEKEKILRKRHKPIVNIISKYADRKASLLDVGSREGNCLKLLKKRIYRCLWGRYF